MKYQVIHSPVAIGARFFPSGRSGTADTRWGKRVFDLALAGIVLPVLLPMILAIAGVVALDGGAPFFGHRQVGKGGARVALLEDPHHGSRRPRAPCPISRRKPHRC